MPPRTKEERTANRNKFDGHLAQLADGIGTDDEFESRGNAATDRIFRLLQTKSRYCLDRLRVAGGKGKKTSIRGHVDYDCVVYINREEPPFDDVIAEFRTLLIRHLGITNVKVTRFSLQFELNGVDFDLLPATNEVGTHITKDTAKEQVRKTLAKIKGIPSDLTRSHSAALTEGAVDFIKSRSLFVHRFIRLCKLWKLGVGASLSGGSTMIETVAVQVAEEEETNHGHRGRTSPSLRVALTKFFEKMQSRDIRVTFDYNYERKDIPSRIAREKLLVVDVTNPSNNLLSRGLPGAFSTKAGESLVVIINRLCPEAYKRDLRLSDIRTIF